MPTEREQVREIFNNGGTNRFPVTIDGQPFDEAIQLPKLKNAQEAEVFARVLKSKGKNGFDNPDDFTRGMRMLREFDSANPSAFASQDTAVEQADPRIVTSAVPTGVREIDKAGQTVLFSSGSGNLPNVPIEVPSIDNLPFDHPLRIQQQRAQEGVDFRRGLPFAQRAKIATLPNIPALRSRGIQRMLSENFAKIPEGLPKFRFDQGSQDFQILQPIEQEHVDQGLEDKESIGKFRWVSLDGTGIELGDLGDMLNLGEIGSMVGSLVGTGKAKVFTFGGRLGTGGGAAVGGLAGGNLGRLGGESLSIVTNFIASGDAPTFEELQDAGMDATQIELLASMTGELGAKILRTVGSAGQEAVAKGSGRQGVVGTQADIDQANVNIKQTKQDLVTVRDSIGREDLAVTEGTSTHSIDLIEQENFALKNAAKSTQREFNRAQARSDRALQDYINKEFGGNPKFLGDAEGTVVRANDQIDSLGKIVVSQTDDGVIHFSPKTAPDQGIQIREGVDDQWQIQKVSLPDHLRGVGLGTESYRAAALEAQAHGKRISSDDNVTEAAAAVWDRLIGTEGFEGVTRHPEAFFNKELKRWEMPDKLGGVAVFSSPTPTPLTKQLLRQDLQITGRAASEREFGRFLRTPGRRELGTVVKEMEANPFLRNDIKQAVLEDYNRVVGKDNKFNAVAFVEWKKATQRTNEEIFSPQEMLAIRQPVGLRIIAENSQKSADQARGAIAKTLKVDIKHPLFRDPSSKSLWNQFKSLSGSERRRAMRQLHATGMADGMQEIFKDELRLKLQRLSSGSNSNGYAIWLKENRNLISDVMGSGRTLNAAEQGRSAASQYLQHLDTVGNIIKRKSDRAMVIGTGAEANPTGLALTRVMFGPLSRAQRFISAARRGTVRSSSAKMGDILTSPERLRELIQIRAFPIASRQVARVVQDMDGVLEFLGLNPDAFDAQDEQSRRALATRVNILLQEELSTAEANE